MCQHSTGFVDGECGASHEDQGICSAGLHNRERTTTFRHPYEILNVPEVRLRNPILPLDEVSLRHCALAPLR
jgi:hypothetical protein